MSGPPSLEGAYYTFLFFSPRHGQSRQLVFTTPGAAAAARHRWLILKARGFSVQPTIYAVPKSDPDA